MFGGFSAIGGFVPDTWVWDGTDWSQRFPTTSPPARFHHAMAYDGARGEEVLFGGAGTMNVPFGDTWILNWAP